ncbi:MAG: hypothetical protein ABI794_00770 [Betaproteobacteria bacterium]
MENARILAILDALTSGVDPLSGEPFPRDSAYQHPDVVRALFHALRAVEGRIEPPYAASTASSTSPAAPPPPSAAPSAGKKKSVRPPAANAGKPWPPEEDERLGAAFDAGTTVEMLARAHDRSRFAIETRLAKLGRAPAPEGMRYPLKNGDTSKVSDAADLRYAA